MAFMFKNIKPYKFSYAKNIEENLKNIENAYISKT